MSLRPKFITFDCYGTLTWFRIGELARALFADRVPADRIDAFVDCFRAYRVDEVLGPWRPYDEVLRRAITRTCRRWNVACSDEEAGAFYRAVPTWGPHADVPAPLARLAQAYPLVILSNAANAQIGQNVKLLGAPFHAVYTAEQAQAYKPRLQAFEFLFDSLGCAPQDVLHVSASLRYDLMPARDLGVRDLVFVDRGYEPGAPGYGYREISDLGGLPALVGL